MQDVLKDSWHGLVWKLGHWRWVVVSLDFQGLLTHVCGIFLENKKVWIVPPRMPSSSPGVLKKEQHMGVV